MIFTFLVNYMLTGVTTIVFAAVPTSHIPIPDLTPLGQSIAGWDKFVPVLGPIRAAFVVMQAFTVFAIVKTGLWIYRMIPVFGGGDG